MRDRRRIFNLVGGEPRFEVKNHASGRAQVYLYDEISWFGVTAVDFVAELSELGGQDFDLHVSSPGGDVFEGLAMLTSLRASPGQVTAYVDGVAASAASFILMGADEVVMNRNTELMIHDAWGMCLGNASDMRDMAGRLDKVSDNIADVYVSKAGKDVGYWRDQMKAEAWFTPAEALDVGLIDRVAGEAPESSGAVAYDLTRFGNRKRPETNQVPAVVEEENPNVDLRSILRTAFEEAA